MPGGLDFTITSNTEVYGQIFQQWIGQLNSIESRMLNRNSHQIGELVSNFIIDKIAELHPLHEFMADSTESTVEANSANINIYLQGRPMVSPRHGGDHEYNFWAMFEWGRDGGTLIQPKGENGVLAFQKMEGGKTIFARYVRQGAVTKYVGEVRSILDQITPDIERLLVSTVAQLIDEYARVALVDDASRKGVKLVIPSQPVKIGSGIVTGTTQATLKNLGYNISVNERTGQVNLRDSKGRFSKHTDQIKGLISTDPNFITFKVSG